MNAQLSIRPGVYFAAVQGEGVVMDLVADRYYGLGAQSANLWRTLLEGHAVEPIAASDIIARQLDAWQQANLVTAASDAPADLPTLKPVGAPAAIGLDEDRIVATRFSWLGLLHLMRAARWSRGAMQRCGICGTLQQLQQIPVSEVAQQAGLDEVLHRMMRVYRSSRRVVSQGKDDCLPRSLALAGALRRLGVDAEICFGVQKFPFSAHAWLETGGRVINETPDRVQPYTLLARF
jgi:hypothetical protein